MIGLLPLLVLFPLLGGLVILYLAGKGSELLSAKKAGVLVAAITLFLSLILLTRVWAKNIELADANVVRAPVQAAVEFKPAWLSIHLSQGKPLQLALGVDGLGMSMVLLTTIVTFSVLVFAMLAITKDYAEYAGWTLLAEAGLLLVFVSMDLFLFYIGFELALLPLLVLISRWGSAESGAAAKRFVLYTLAGSIPMIVALLAIVGKYSPAGAPTVLFSELSKAAALVATTDPLANQTWIFALLVLGLGIKMALLPFHTWLPSTYGASHPTTAALLAAVVLKLGIFGFLRIALPLTPVACFEYGPQILGTLGAVAIVYGALAALAQTDLRLLLAYSSLSHVGFITIGLFALNEEGVAGASLQMFNHGITTAAMFLLAGSLIARRGTSHIERGAKGLASIYPRLAVLMVFFVVAGAGMPGLNNFVGEMMTLTAMMARNPLLSAIAATGIVFGAWYGMKLVRDLLFGQLEKGKSGAEATIQGDLRAREWIPLTGLALICLFIGIVPQGAISLMRSDAIRLVKPFREGKAANTQALQINLEEAKALQLAKGGIHEHE